MFDFKAPKTPGYLKAVEQARLVVAARKELHAAERGPMLEFADTAALAVAIDKEVAKRREAMAQQSRRALAIA